MRPAPAHRQAVCNISNISNFSNISNVAQRICDNEIIICINFIRIFTSFTTTFGIRISSSIVLVVYPYCHHPYCHHHR